MLINDVLLFDLNLNIEIFKIFFSWNMKAFYQNKNTPKA